MEREPGINNPYPLPSKRDIAITAIDAAIAEEREACAKVADEQQLEGECPERASYIAAAIRARGNQ